MESARPLIAPEPRHAPRVLVVDDSRLQLKVIESLLIKSGYDVMTATSGEEALDIARRDPLEMILSDWMMPGMSGIDLCKALHASKHAFYSYFILLTSKSEKEDIAQGLDAGADDFLSKPVNPAELRARMNAGARVVEMERQLQEKNREVSETLADLQEAHRAIDRDLRQARKIQQALVPERSRVFGDSRISLLLRPCGHVGGDLVGMFSAGPDCVGFYNIDVSGHGVTSAMVTARVAGYLSSKFPDQNLALAKSAGPFHAVRAPNDTAALLNERLTSDPGVEEYLTMLYATLNLTSGALRMVQAGHPPPLLVRENGEVSFIGEGGMPVGLFEGAQFEPVCVDLAKGDRLLLYSDGFTEAVVKSGEMLGQDGLVALVQQSIEAAKGPDLLEDMFWRLTQVMQTPDDMGDDVSAALLEYGGITENAA